MHIEKGHGCFKIFTWRLRIVDSTELVKKKRCVTIQKSSQAAYLWCNDAATWTTSLVKPLAPLRPHPYSPICVSLGAFCPSDGVSIERRILERWEPIEAVQFHLVHSCWQKLPENPPVIVQPTTSVKKQFMDMKADEVRGVWLMFKTLWQTIGIRNRLGRSIQKQSTTWPPWKRF